MLDWDYKDTLRYKNKTKEKKEPWKKETKLNFDIKWLVSFILFK